MEEPVGCSNERSGTRGQSSKSYFCQPKTQPLIYKSLPEKFQENVTKHPNKTAIIVRFSKEPKQTISYSELHRKAEILAKHLVSNGMKSGDRVAVSVHNSIEWVISEFGVFYAGGVAVNLIPAKRKKLPQTLVNMACSAAILDWRWSEDCSGIGEFLNASPKLINIHIFGVHNAHAPKDGLLILHDLLQTPCNDPEIELPEYIDPDSICLMWSTSGSTGKSKFVPHSHMTIVNCQDTFMRGLGIKPSDVILQERPMAYGLGFPQHLVSWGGTHVYVNTNDLEESKTTEFIFDVMREEGGTVAFFPSFMLSEMDRLTKEGEYVPRLRTGLITGQCLDQHTTDLYKKYGENIRFGYGLTDTLLCTATPHGNIEWDRDTIGSHIFPGIEFKIIGDDGLLVPFDTDGEICIRGPNCTKGYVRDDGSSLPALDKSGWFLTGDVGTLRQDGLVTVKGRKKEIIRRGDVDIFPAAVEGELMKHPDVEEAVVIGISITGELQQVCACVLGRSGLSIDKAEIRAFADGVFKGRQALMPDLFLVLSELPRLPSGKPDRLTLQRHAVSTLTQTKI